jgi:hypothetical protein
MLTDRGRITGVDVHAGAGSHMKLQPRRGKDIITSPLDAIGDDVMFVLVVLKSSPSSHCAGACLILQ